MGQCPTEPHKLSPIGASPISAFDREILLFMSKSSFEEIEDIFFKVSPYSSISNLDYRNRVYYRTWSIIDLGPHYMIYPFSFNTKNTDLFLVALELFYQSAINSNNIVYTETNKFDLELLVPGSVVIADEHLKIDIENVRHVRTKLLNDKPYYLVINGNSIKENSLFCFSMNSSGNNPATYVELAICDKVITIVGIANKQETYNFHKKNEFYNIDITKVTNE